MVKKIKIAMLTNHFGITGISTVILNYCKELDHSKFDLTVIAGRPIDEENRKDCDKYGIELIELPSRHKSPIGHYKGLWNEFHKNTYDILHVHGSSSMMAIEMTVARMSGINRIIAHSHNSSCPNILIHKILNPYFKTLYSKALACGELAGNWLFGENHFEVLPNGFYTKDFIFNPVERDCVQTELSIKNKFVIGHIGRFNNQKNQSFLLDVFEEVAKKRKNAVLMLVGNGPDYNRIYQAVQKHPFKDRIILYGVTKNTHALYNLMDVFVLPSKYEGLPVVLLEAQISGLPCIVSDRVTREVDFGNIIWKSIDDEPEKWAKLIKKMQVSNMISRQMYYLEHEDLINTYDISNTVIQLEKIYHTLMKDSTYQS